MQLTNSLLTQFVRAAALSFTSLPLLISSAIADAPALNITEYELTSNNVEECVNSAEFVMKEEGFQELNVTQRDVFGTTGDISVEMYCVRDGKTLVLVLAGSNPDELQKVQSKLDKRLSH
ncbi:MAG TPA: hypothetical protein V6C85_11565 [Allocoleopsis sp.]